LLSLARSQCVEVNTIITVSGALDFESKTVFDAMTPIDKVFMLRIDAKLDYETLARVVRSGHSRVPVFEVVEVGGVKSKKILGILLVKQVGSDL
jgi:CBS domain containing-hemolysin-like protein